MSTRTGRPTRRPADRKSQILTAAAECFHQAGYHATSMEDIAAAVGITAGGLYRHFRGKQELLSRVLLDGLELFSGAMAESDDLDTMIRSIARFSLDHRMLPMLLERESGNLSEQDLAKVNERHSAHAATLQRAVLVSRPDLEPWEAWLLAWGVIAVLSSPSYHRRNLPRPHFEDLLCAQATALCGTRALPAVGGRPAARSGTGLSHVSRREALLAAAIPLFRARGFQMVSMESIGAAAGIAGPSIYNHFASKAEILATALHREAEVLHFSLAKALTESSTADEALGRVLRSYAVLCGSTGSAIPLLVGRLGVLSPDEQQRSHSAQVGFVTECYALLRTCRPGLSEDEAGVLMPSALTVILILSRLLAARDTTCPEVLAGIAMDSLGVTAPPPPGS
ncbi:TetR/AcrR family transcriptional regulator [Streptomyces sp. NPDC102451]|uniref:TetR/AcrR family transcriptional regulator n=1 Tax=Streptomyces sp. NPDC102451 TaxID=3366177 RepID=UPI003801C313